MSMQSVALINYGSGNLRSAEKALIRAADGKSEIVVTDDPDIIATADRIVLPGVGAFAACMGALEARSGVIEAMTEAVHGKGAPFLGICVGMQLLASRGLEFGETVSTGSPATCASLRMAAIRPSRSRTWAGTA
jgi:glutamine amidotransferase